MTDILERMEEALLNTDSLVLDGDEMAMDHLGLSALTLLPEAMREIERLRYQLRGLIVSVTEEDKLKARAEAAEAKVAKLEAAIAAIRGEKP